MDMRINRLPAITWNRMDINDISVNLPESSGANLTFDTKNQEKWATRATVSGEKIQTGAGENADPIFEKLPVYALTAEAGEAVETLAEYRGNGNQGAVLTVNAGENSQITLYTHVKPDENDTAALRLLLNIGKNAKVRLVELLEPGKDGTMLHDLGGIVGENAEIEVLHLYLARGLTFGATHPDADEFLQVRRLPFDTLLARCLSGEIEDGKTVTAVLKAKLLGL